MKKHPNKGNKMENDDSNHKTGTPTDPEKIYRIVRNNHPEDRHAKPWGVPTITLVNPPEQKTVKRVSLPENSP